MVALRADVIPLDRKYQQHKLFSSEYLLRQTDEMKPADSLSSNSQSQILSVPAQPPESTLLRQPLKLTELHGSSYTHIQHSAQRAAVLSVPPHLAELEHPQGDADLPVPPLSAVVTYPKPKSGVDCY